MALPNRIHLSESNHEACLEDRQNPNRIVWPRQPAKSSSSLGHLPGSDGVDALSQPIFTRSQASGSRGMCRPKARASKRGVLPRVSGLHLVHWLSVRSYQKGQGTHLQRFVRARIGYVSGNGAAFSNIPPQPIPPSRSWRLRGRFPPPNRRELPRKLLERNKLPSTRLWE